MWAVTWSLMSCMNQNFEEMKEIPVFNKENFDNKFIDRADLALYFGKQKSFNWSDTKVPTDVEITILDSRFKVVDYFFFAKFNKWFKKLQFENGFLPIDQKENLDCDNFAMLYKSLMSVSSYKSPSKHEPAVGLIVVKQKNSFGGIPKGYLHMLNLVFTNQGWYIFEPQTGKFDKLENYPNQEYIEYIIL